MEEVEIATKVFQWLQSIYNGDMTTYHEVYDSIPNYNEKDYFQVLLAFAIRKMFDDIENEVASIENLQQFTKSPSILALTAIDHPIDKSDEWK